MATKYKTAKPFKIDDWQGGGGAGLVPEGIYRIEELRAVMFDYAGKVPEGACCLCVKLQPLNSNLKPEGDLKVQYYNLSVHAPGLSQEEWITAQHTIRPSKDGKKLELPEDYELGNKCDGFLFMEALGKAGFDLDQLEESGDLSAIDGLIADIGKVPSTRKPSKDAKKDKDGNPFPVWAYVVKSIPANTKAAGGKSNGKAANGAPKPESKKEESDELDPEAILLEYMEGNVLTSGNADGYDKLKARMGIATYVQKEKKGDSEVVKAVVGKFNDDDYLENLLTSFGWAIKSEKGKNLIYKGE